MKYPYSKEVNQQYPTLEGKFRWLIQQLENVYVNEVPKYKEYRERNDSKNLYQPCTVVDDEEEGMTDDDDD